MGGDQQDVVEGETLARELLVEREEALELGAGRFEPREAARLQSGVRVEELQPAVS